MGSRLTLGYRNAVAVSTSALAQLGLSMRGHEFHYSKVVPASGPTPAWSFGSAREGFVVGGVHASYLHTHWAAFAHIADRLVAACVEVAA
jgi:cobyrinic acid a,c-diamide synthase